MAAPPAKKAKQSRNAISIVVEKWKINQTEQFSPVHRISGYPWRLRVYNRADKTNKKCLAVICDMSTEAELWGCLARFSFTMGELNPTIVECTLNFNSSDEGSHERDLLVGEFKEGRTLEVAIDSVLDGEEWRRRPILDPLDPRDGILVIGEEKKKVYVNKESLASQSPFFDKLFNGDFKEKNMTEIPIGDVEYEDFSNIIKMIYGFESASLTDENVLKILQLADRFEIKIVEDRVVSYLVSKSCTFSIQQKLLISEQYNIPFMTTILLQCTDFSKDQFKELSESPEWDQLSSRTLRTLFKKCYDQLP